MLLLVVAYMLLLGAGWLLSCKWHACLPKQALGRQTGRGAALEILTSGQLLLLVLLVAFVLVVGCTCHGGRHWVDRQQFCLSTS